MTTQNSELYYRYNLTCKVLAKTVKTNPKQFTDLVKKYNITAEELENSYVSREGRQKLVAEGLNAESAMLSYGIHPNVATSLKCLRTTGKGGSIVPLTISVESSVVSEDFSNHSKNPIDEFILEEIDCLTIFEESENK